MVVRMSSSSYKNHRVFFDKNISVATEYESDCGDAAQPPTQSNIFNTPSSSKDHEIENPTNPRPTRNISQACTFCKKRHIRCNGVHPCVQCLKRNLQCSFGTRSKSGPKPKTDLYEYCNILMVDLEAHKRIADHWRDQFMETLQLKGSIECDHSVVPQHYRYGCSFNADHDLAITSTCPQVTGNNHHHQKTIANTTTLLPKIVENSLLIGGYDGHVLQSQPPIEDSNESSLSPQPNQMTLIHPSQAGLNASCSSEMIVQQEIQSIGDSIGHSKIYPPSIPELEHIYHQFLNFAPIIVGGDYHFIPNIKLALDIWNFSTIQKYLLDCYHIQQPLSPAPLIEHFKIVINILEHCILASVGFCLCHLPVFMHSYAYKAEECLRILCFEMDAIEHNEFTNQLVQMIIILHFYYAGDSHRSKKNVAMIAYQLISNCCHHIQPLSIYRVYCIIMTQSDHPIDSLYWFNQIANLEIIINSPFHRCYAILTHVLCSLHPKNDFESPPPSFKREQLLSLFKKLEETDYLIQSMTTSFPIYHNQDISLDIINILKIIQSGCRCELLYLTGDYVRAKTTAQKTIELSQTIQYAIHLVLLGLECAIEVCIYLNIPNLIQIGISILDRHCPSLDICSRFKKKIQTQINAIDRAIRGHSST